MADVYALNQVPPGGETTRDLYMAWDLGRKMIDAGWTVWGSSDGTSFSTSGTDHWATYANSNLPGAWLALINPDGLRGYCFQCDTVGAYNITYGRVWSYTQTGWSSSGASATVAPLAVGNTSYLSGTPGAPRWCYLGCGSGDAPNRECHVYHLIVRDAATDGSFAAIGFKNGGGSALNNLVHYAAVSFVYSPWDLPVSDNQVFWLGTLGNGWLPGTYTPPGIEFNAQTQIYCKPPLDAALRASEIAVHHMIRSNTIAADLVNCADGFGDGSSAPDGTSTLIRENATIYTRAGFGPIYKGIAKWFYRRNAGISTGFQGTYEWYAIDTTTGGVLWIPWDGVTTTFDSGT